MKITELVKQLNALKKLHGNVECAIINGETGYPNNVLAVTPLHPLNGMGCCDRTKPA